VGGEPVGLVVTFIGALCFNGWDGCTVKLHSRWSGSNESVRWPFQMPGNNLARTGRLK
jgi:hypothetical protein